MKNWMDKIAAVFSCILALLMLMVTFMAYRRTFDWCHEKQIAFVIIVEFVVSFCLTFMSAFVIACTVGVVRFAFCKNTKD